MALPKYGLAMSGGSLKGAFQIGAMKALRERGYLELVQYSVGTSVGAINSGGLAYLGLDDLEKIYLSLEKRSDIFSHSWWKFWNIKGLFSLKPYQTLLREAVKDKYSRFEAVACCADLSDGKTKYFSSYVCGQDKFLEMVDASATIPVLMEPTHKDLFDGGVTEHTPIMQAAKKCDRVIAITTKPQKAELGKWKRFWPTIISVLWRTVDEVMQIEIFRNDLRISQDEHNAEIRVIAPKERLPVGTFEVSPKKIRELIELGYQAGMEMKDF